MAQLPETVSPGQLITADLINAILEALQGYANINHDFNTLTSSVSGLDLRLQSIEARVLKLESTISEIQGVIKSLRTDRDDIVVKIDHLRGDVIPELREQFSRIDTTIAERMDPIERRIGEVELRVVRDTDPIERLPGITREHVDVFREHGIENVAAIRERSGDISRIIADEVEARRLGNLVGRIQ